MQRCRCSTHSRNGPRMKIYEPPICKSMNSANLFFSHLYMLNFKFYIDSHKLYINKDSSFGLNIQSALGRHYWFYRGERLSYQLKMKDLKSRQSSEMLKQSPWNLAPWYDSCADISYLTNCRLVSEAEPQAPTNGMLSQVINLCNIFPRGIWTSYSQWFQSSIRPLEEM